MSTLVFLHGFTGSPRTFDDVLLELPVDQPILSPLLAGHGGDPFPESVRQFGDEVERLRQIIDARGPEPVHLVGYSLGARLALALLLGHPSRVARGTLIGANPGLPTEAARAGRRGQDAVWARLLDEEGLDAFVAAWEKQPLFATLETLPEERRAAQRKERLGHDPRGLAAALRVLGLGAMPDFLPALASCTVPLDLVVGEHDAAFRAHAERMIGACAAARLRIVSGAGHNVPRESPLALARILTEEIAP
jgi:2-succinyl-6-hydroxy-2,4-cyclohexadiene-1-carboxylate synthase